MGDRFTLKELDVPDPLDLVLEEADLPFAMENETPAFEGGGKLVRERMDLPGRRTPMFHMLAAPERPLVVRGAFRDWLAGRGDGHARAMRDRLYRIWKRANLCRLAWAGEERVVLLDEPKFGEESAYSITYELTFEVAVGPGAASDADPGAALATATADPTKVLRELLDQRRAQLAAAPIQPSPLAPVNAAFNLAVSSLDAFNRELDALDQATGPAAAPVARVADTGRAARNALAAARAALRAVVPARDLVAQDAAGRVGWWAAQFAAEATLYDTEAGVQAARVASRRRLYLATRLYRVRPGDTLESIAQQTLGSAARASELGLRPEQLVAGAFVRIPEPA